MDIVEYLKGRSRWDILQRGAEIFIKGFVTKIQEEYSDLTEKPVLDIYFDPTHLYQARLGFAGLTEVNGEKLGNAIDFNLKYVDESIDWNDRMEVIKNYKKIIEPLADYIVTRLHQSWSNVSLELLQSKLEGEALIRAQHIITLSNNF